MTSRVIPHRPLSKPNEQYVMIFAQLAEYNGDVIVNEAATKLLARSCDPIHLNIPYQCWKLDKMLKKDGYEEVITSVYGNVIIAREQKIDQRWQLVSM